MPAGTHMADDTALGSIVDDYAYSYWTTTDVWWIKLPGMPGPVGIIPTEHGASLSAGGLNLTKPIHCPGYSTWTVADGVFTENPGAMV